MGYFKDNWNVLKLKKFETKLKKKKKSWFVFRVLQGEFKCYKIIKFKRNLEIVIWISVWDTWSLVQRFRIIKFKRNLIKEIRISILDSSMIL